MNDLRPQDVEAYLQRVIDLLEASKLRKAAMRDELFAHLFEAYKIEVTRRTDPDAALQAVFARVGQPDELRQQFQASIPWYERTLFNVLHRKDHVMRRAMMIGSFSVVLLFAAWIVFAAVMMSDEIFHRYPPHSEIRLTSAGLIQVVTTDGKGNVVNTLEEAFNPVVIPALAVPFAVLVIFALVGCYSLAPRAHRFSQGSPRTSPSA